MVNAGLALEGLYGIEGPGWMLPDVEERLKEPERRATRPRVPILGLWGVGSGQAAAVMEAMRPGTTPCHAARCGERQSLARYLLIGDQS